MKDPITIEHDPNEPPIDRTKGPWLIGAVFFGVVTLGLFIQGKIDWVSLCLGFTIGLGLMGWAIEITGDKIPASWRGKPPRTR